MYTFYKAANISVPPPRRSTCHPLSSSCNQLPPWFRFGLTHPSSSWTINFTTASLPTTMTPMSVDCAFPWRCTAYRYGMPLSMPPSPTRHSILKIWYATFYAPKSDRLLFVPPNPMPRFGCLNSDKLKKLVPPFIILDNVSHHHDAHVSGLRSSPTVLYALPLPHAW